MCNHGFECKKSGAMQRTEPFGGQPHDMPPPDINRLVRECLKNKREAQKALYDHFAPTMLALCFRYTKNLDDAENILQDGFVKVFQNLGNYRRDGELGAWIRKIMVNTALSYLKTHRKYYHEMVFQETYLHRVSDEDPEMILTGKEIEALIRQLPTGYQTVFNLHAVEGYTHVEIAGMLGISDGTSRSQYARARSLLIEWLTEISLKEKGGSYGK